MDFILIISSLISIILSLLIVPLLPKGKKSIAGFLIILSNSVFASIPAIQVLLNDTIIQHSFNLVYPFENIRFRIDPLAAWFILIINMTCLNGSLYGIGYLKSYEVQKNNISLHWILFVIFQTSMIWVCMLQNGLAFLVAWEIMSISSLLLLMFEHAKPETLKAGMNYLIQMHIAAALIAIAFIWVYQAEGSFDFSAIDRFFTNHSPIWVFPIFFVGFGIKAGFIPLHTWLPHAHPAAPSHISGVMSGVIVKLGIYGILRMITYLHTGLLQTGESILIISVLTTLYGILNAAIHRDFKRMLAFCTIENIGIIGMGIGIGLIGKAVGNPLIFFIGFAAALLHTLNHSLYKSLLFFAAGNIYQQTHTRNMEHLGGLIKKMPATAFLFLCGSLAISAVPPFNGFISEFLIYSGLVEGIKASNAQFNLLMILSIASLAMAGGVSILTFTKSFGTIFLGTPRVILTHQPKEVVKIMQIPMFIILVVMLLIGIFPNMVLSSVVPAVKVFDNSLQPGTTILMFSPVLEKTGEVSMILIGLTAFIYYLRVQVTKYKTQYYTTTWGCGYKAQNTRMQYTGRSFSRSLAKLFGFFIIEKKKYHEIDSTSIFPSSRSYQSSYEEFFESRIIDKLNNRLSGFMNYFTFIHNGQTQMYVLYGLFFIISLIVITFFNLI
jgi:hydrogenase-4 component B